MGKAARKIQNRILEEMPPNKRLFPINSGMGWQGKVIKHDKDIMILQHPRPLHAAPIGWPDLVGFETVEITPEMVGQKIAIFTAEEIKAGNDRMRKAQKNFKKLFESMGCIYRIIKG